MATPQPPELTEIHRGLTKKWKPPFHNENFPHRTYIEMKKLFTILSYLF